MSTDSIKPLNGQDTLVASWRALARQSPGARVTVTPKTVAAVFPAWLPLNNAILLERPSSATAAGAADELRDRYRSTGVDAWALWLPARTTSVDASDVVTAVAGMRRDTTTLVMQLTIPTPAADVHPLVRTTTGAAVRAGDETVPAAELPRPDADAGLDAWVIVRGDRAVAGAWSLVEGTDCGIYTVATAPEWRRRGLARALMTGILGDAYRQGARTATLQSTSMGVPLYASLGFEAVGRYEEWVPA